MEFSQPKGIYQQIADQLRDRILAGEWHEGARIPSVRELATSIGVNPNTVTKSYQALLDREVIENQRGIGYFVALDAKQKILAEMKDAVRARGVASPVSNHERARNDARRPRGASAASQRREDRMKRSVAAVVTAIGIVAALMLALALWVRVAAPSRDELPRNPSGERATRSYDFAGFTGIETSGQWQVTLVRGDAWAVEVSYPAELERFMAVRKDGDTLVLGYNASA